MSRQMLEGGVGGGGAKSEQISTREAELFKPLKREFKKGFVTTQSADSKRGAHFPLRFFS